MGQNIQKKFTKIQNQVRMRIMNFIVDEGRAYHVKYDKDTIMTDCSIGEKEYQGIISCLCEKDGMVADDQGYVNFIYPVSAIPTNHRVTLSDGRVFTAMCAIDAIGAAFTFAQDIEVQSCCSGCGKPINISINDGILKDYSPNELHVLSFQLEELANWAGSC